MKLKSLVLPVSLTLSGVAAGALLVAAGAEEPSRAAPSSSVPRVSVMTAQRERVPLTLRQAGVVTAAHEVELAARVAGPLTWTAEGLRPGRRVDAEELLARVDDTAFRSSVADARSSLASAEEALALELGKAEVAGLEQTLVGGQISDLARRLPQRASAEASVTAARAALSKAQRDLANTQLRAPFAGMIVEESLERGAYVNAGTVVGRLVSADEVWVSVSLAPSMAVHLQIPGYNAAEGSETRVWLPGATASRLGTVIGVQGEVDTTTRAVTVLVSVADPFDPEAGPVLLPGSFVEVEAVGRAVADGVRLPTAMLHDGSSVWTVGADDVLARVQVEVVWRAEEHVVVTGLEDGARVVSEASGMLLAGTAVEVEA